MKEKKKFIFFILLKATEANNVNRDAEVTNQLKI